MIIIFLYETKKRFVGLQKHHQIYIGNIDIIYYIYSSIEHVNILKILLNYNDML